jgi:U3 small nucleolar RNA-associated protein 10
LVRQRSVFGFLALFFDNLKSIVTSYAAYVISGAVQLLSGKTVNGKFLSR